MSSTRPVFPVVVAGLLLAVCAASPQAPPTTLQSNASLVLVDVVVTNKGKPVQCLNKSQFKVMEDGKRKRLLRLKNIGRLHAQPQRRPAWPRHEHPSRWFRPCPGGIYRYRVWQRWQAIESQRYRLRIPPESRPVFGRDAARRPPQVELDLPAGHIFLRVAVHDLLSNRMGSTEFPLNVVAPKQAAVSRLPSS